MKKITDISKLRKVKYEIANMINEADSHTFNISDEDFNEDVDNEEYDSPKFRVEMTRTVTSYVVVYADSPDEAEDMVQVGIEVSEDGSLSARDDMAGYIVDYGAESSYDEITSVEEVE